MPIRSEDQDSFDDWLLKKPLYEKVVFHTDAARKFQCDLRSHIGIVDWFCPSCEKSATFRFVKTPEAESAEKHVRLTASVSIGPGRVTYSRPAWDDGWFEVRIRCTRAGHTISFFFSQESEHGSEKSSIEKVGQTYSLADLAYPETQRFAAILGKEKYREYRRGIGLASHGANIGAFTYLRRVFDYLLEMAHAKEVTESANWDETAYVAGRTADRVKLLANRLPQSFIDNSVIYAILSAGMHELSEADCGRYFETLKDAIDLMHDETLATASRVAAEAKLRASVSVIASELKSSGT